MDVLRRMIRQAKIVTDLGKGPFDERDVLLDAIE